jgi:hypothetical protein
MKFINCTPHPITIRDNAGTDLTIAPSGVVPRVVGETRDAVPVGEIPVRVDGPGVVEGLPDPEPGVALIVSGMVLTALAGSGRVDVFAPGTGPADGAVRNEAGHIVAVTCLKAVAAKQHRLANEVTADLVRKIAREISALRKIADWALETEGQPAAFLWGVADRLEALIK